MEFVENATRDEDHLEPQGLPQDNLPFAVLQDPAAQELAVAVCLTVLLTASIATCSCKYPKAMGIFVLVWVVWFIAKFAQGKGAEIYQNAQLLEVALADEVRATGTLLLRLMLFVLPFLRDAWCLARPLVDQLEQIWAESSAEERTLLGVCLLACTGTILILVAACQHKETVANATFHVSFVVVGPLVAWLVMQLPYAYCHLLIVLTTSIVPIVMSLHTHGCIEQGRQTFAADSALGRASLFHSDYSEEFSDPDLLDRAQMWLSYWSCYPFVYISNMVLLEIDIFNLGDGKPAVAGTIVAVVLWLQWWRMSRISTCLFALILSCYTRSQNSERSATDLSDQTGQTADHGASPPDQTRGAGQTNDQIDQTMGTGSAAAELARAAQSHAIQLVIQSDGGWQKWAAIVIAGVAIVVAVLSLLLRVFELLNALFVLAFLLAAAGDSARWVNKKDLSMCAARLAFWAIAIAWMILCMVPFLRGFLANWTLLVLIVAFVAGETALAISSRCLTHLTSAVGTRLSRGNWRPARIPSDFMGRDLAEAE